jgi:hypothetical protein
MDDTKPKRLRPVRPRKPKEGINVFIDFPEIENDEQLEETTKRLKVVVCGALHIVTHKCIPSYMPETKTVRLLFHFSRQKWALKAEARLAAMQGLFSAAKLSKEFTPAVPTKRELGLDKAAQG